MLVDLVQVDTPEGIKLSGAYFAPAGVDRQSSADALIYFHGDGGHFYNPLYLWLGQRMAERGIAFLAANRRGHDHVANGARGGPLAGYAFESVDDSRADYAAWLALLRERGHTRIVMGGHSGGAVQGHLRAGQREVRQRDWQSCRCRRASTTTKGVIALHGEDFLGPFRESERNVAEGRPDALLRPGVPWGSTWSARAYVDCFNQDNRYSVTRHAANTGVPTHFIFGGEECAIGGPQELPVCGRARRSVAAAGYPHVQVTEIEGANHGYVGREEELFQTMFTWLSEPLGTSFRRDRKPFTQSRKWGFQAISHR